MSLSPLDLQSRPENLVELHRQISDVLSSEEYDEAFLPPSPEAARTALRMSAATSSAWPKDCPRTVVAPTGDGGLMIQWGGAGRLVRWLLPAAPDRAYLYFEAGEERNSLPATEPNLIRLLAWLTGN